MCLLSKGHACLNNFEFYCAVSVKTIFLKEARVNQDTSAHTYVCINKVLPGVFFF